MSDLFADGPEAPPPAARDRPLADGCGRASWATSSGQEHLLAPEAPLARMLARGRLASLILWGPPGCGKTTLARMLAGRLGEPLMALSAVMAGVADLREVLRGGAEAARRAGGGRSCSSTRSTASTARSRTGCCTRSRTGR